MRDTRRDTGQMTTEEREIVVLGLGNLLRRDEGLGIRVLHRLRDRYDFPASVRLVDGGTDAVGGRRTDQRPDGGTVRGCADGQLLHLGAERRGEFGGHGRVHVEPVRGRTRLAAVAELRDHRAGRLTPPGWHCPRRRVRRPQPT